MKTVYGPVSSWRLGTSLGIDLLCTKEKTCSFNCIYCQLGKETNKIIQRKEFISLETLRKDLETSLKKTNPEVITLAGTGEPTLAKNIDQAIKLIINLTNLPITIITNSTLLGNKDVQKSLLDLDSVVAKLDASNNQLLDEINQPHKSIHFDDIVKGIKSFKDAYSKKFCLQIMFMKPNKNYAEELAEIAYEIQPAEVQINTPLRPCLVKPLGKKELSDIEKIFTAKKLNTISVYTRKKAMTSPLDKFEKFKRRREYR